MTDINAPNVEQETGSSTSNVQPSLAEEQVQTGRTELENQANSQDDQADEGVDMTSNDGQALVLGSNHENDTGEVQPTTESPDIDQRDMEVYRDEDESGPSYRQDTRRSNRYSMPAGSQAYDDEEGLQPPPLGRIQSETGTAPTHGYGDTRHLDGTVMFSWIKDIESRIVTIEENKKREENEALEKAKPDNLEQLMLQMEPDVRECNWEHFKNRYSELESRYAIETLVASDDLAGEMEAEQLIRIPPAKRRPFTLSPRKPVRQTQTGKTKDQRLERVRINSAIVLAYLAKVTGQSTWSKKPHTFLKPFKVLVHFHDKMEQEFRELEKKFGNSQEMSAETSDAPGDDEATKDSAIDKGKTVDNVVTVDAKSQDDQTHNVPPSEDPLSAQLPQNVEEAILPQETSEGEPSTADYEKALKEAMDSKKGFEDMRCYMDFARDRLLTLYHSFDKADYNHPAKIRFDDLWSLYRVGELVYQRTDSGTDVAQPGSDGPRAPQNAPRLFRIYFTWQDIPYWIVEDLETIGAKLRRDADVEPSDARVACYYVDYDGKSYSGVPHLFDIEPYEGEKDITKLPIYPIRFAKDSEKILKDLQERGQRFTEFISKKDRALAHSGWTLTTDPVGDDIEDDSGHSIRFPQHIDSDVVIDFQEAYQANPWWKPNFPKFVPGQYKPVNLVDNFTITEWSGQDRYEAITKIEEVVVSADDVYRLEWNEFAVKDKFIVEQDERRDEDDNSTKQVKQDLSDQDLALLPSRLFVYALRERKFVNADIKCLKPIKPLERPFDNLKIEEKHKEMIQSIVFEHFEKKKLQKKAADTNRELSDQDFIRGKGKGLVILLHGAPGVGKTATAEALSYVYNKPLFPITCGDLGIEPEDVEENLSEIFRLANLWDCMLLLDEAEIFLSHREKKDDNLQRNALVSIFLRTLEYYGGILFLTTNRAGTLDEAVKSRVHISLHYRSLGMKETLAIFKLNLNRLTMIEKERAAINDEEEFDVRDEEIEAFAIDHFEYKPDTRWNGRQIRNAFQMAQSLAHYQHHIKPTGQKPYIGREHFQNIADVSGEYDRYRHDMFGGTDQELALKREERGRDYSPRRRHDAHSSYRGEHHSGYDSRPHRAPPANSQRHQPPYHHQQRRHVSPTPPRGQPPMPQEYSRRSPDSRSFTATPVAQQPTPTSSYNSPQASLPVEHGTRRPRSSGYDFEDQGPASQESDAAEYGFRGHREPVTRERHQGRSNTYGDYDPSSAYGMD